MIDLLQSDQERGRYWRCSTRRRHCSLLRHFVLDATWSLRHRHVPNIPASPWKDNGLQDRLHKYHQTLLAPQARRDSCPLCYWIGPTIAPGPDAVSFLGVPVCVRGRDRRDRHSIWTRIPLRFSTKANWKRSTKPGRMKWSAHCSRL